MEQLVFECDECGSEFETKTALAGHKGGAHSKDLVPIKHGTEYGYVQHVRREVPIGDDDECGCRAAHAKFQGDRRRALNK